MSSKISSKQTESPDISLKRKRTSRSVETSKISSVDSCKKACPTGDADNRLAIQPPPILPVKVDEVNSQEGIYIVQILLLTLILNRFIFSSRKS